MAGHGVGGGAVAGGFTGRRAVTGGPVVTAVTVPRSVNPA